MVPLNNIDLNLILNPCAKFFEKQSGKTFIERNLPFQRDGDTQFEFEFGFEDCDLFKMDPNIKMELFYGELRKFSFSAFTINGNKITV